MSNQKVTLRERRKARIRSKIKGTGERPRLVVFRSLTHISAQIINDETGKVLASASDLKIKTKATKTDKSKEVGTALAKVATEKKVEKVVFDRNGYKYHGRIKALADGAREGGLKF
ncbi:MAG: 50S ribosomal protein L18 [Patescibacteria group bacterium]